MLKIISIGGKVEFKFFLCKFLPENCVSKYIQYINNVQLEKYFYPSLISFGPQVKFTGYNNSSEIIAILQNRFISDGIHIDSIILDSKYLFVKSASTGVLSISDLYKNDSFLSFIQSNNLSQILSISMSIPFDPSWGPFIRGIQN